MTGLSVSTLKRLASSGDLPGMTRIGSSVRFWWPEVEAWIAEGCPQQSERAKHAHARARRHDKR